jgi:hypothetical protein
MQELKEKPYVSSNSNKIIEKMRQEKKNVKDPMNRMIGYQKKAQENRTNRMKIKQEMELEECTGRPQLSEKSRAMFNDITKLIDWEKRKIEKQEAEMNRLVHTLS